MVRDRFWGKVCLVAGRCRTAGVRGWCCVALMMAVGVGCSTVAEDTQARAGVTSFALPLTSYDLLQEIGGRVMDGSAADGEVLTLASVDQFGFLGTNPMYVSINGTKKEVASLGGLTKAGGELRIVNGKLQSTTRQAQLDRDKTR